MTPSEYFVPSCLGDSASLDLKELRPFVGDCEGLQNMKNMIQGRLAT